MERKRATLATSRLWETMFPNIPYLLIRLKHSSLLGIMFRVLQIAPKIGIGLTAKITMPTQSHIVKQLRT
jgi:hypothetical protein